MMKRKQPSIGALCYILTVCGLLALPTITMPFWTSKTAASSENRVLTALPSIRNEDGSINYQYANQLGNWYGDHFGLRSAFVTAYGAITKHLLGTSAEQDVICGKENWLYYTETLDDTIGNASFSETDLRHLITTLSLMSEYAAAHDTKMLFAVAPNKASIYPQYLPSRYLSRESQNNLDLLYSVLNGTNVTVCDLRSALTKQAAADPALLYHKLDTHWNGYGAMIGYTALMQAAGLDDYAFSQKPCSAVQNFDGDLWQMLSPSVMQKDWNIVYDIPQTYSYLGRYRDPDDLMINTACQQGEGSLLMFRDSFGRALIPLLSQRFAACTYTRDSHVPLYLLEQNQTDLVIYELVERNLNHLLEYTPHMPAPQVEPIETQAVSDPKPLRLESRTDGNDVHLYGYYDPAFSDCNAIYCSVTDMQNGTQKYYQAFPCFEAELLGMESCKTNGFSMYLPAADLPKEAKITVIAQQTEQAYDLGSQIIALS